MHFSASHYYSMRYISCMAILNLSALPLSNDPSTVLAHSPAAVSCLPVTVLPIPKLADAENDTHITQRIFVAHQGRGLRWYKTEKETRHLRTAPRMIEIYEKGQFFDHCHWENVGEAGRCVLVEFGDADVVALTGSDFPVLKLRTEHEVFEDRISGLAFELANEALHGMPNGRLYAQGLAVSLIGVLSSRQERAESPKAGSGVKKLGLVEQRRLIDLIYHAPGQDLSLTRLAKEAGMSACHFVRVFKATFGMTPHQYVLERRVEAAADALRRHQNRPIVDIALECGFASQAHMTTLMRRTIGATPGAFRKGD
jgi:AraC family transcriptional regulator